ncbi:phage antirepressor KilAC domain-containing protein [Pseudomonas sp. Irchel s3f10]|uniref:phage antirepressor KilAC domain-containing protein n=1 Tax=Pseudomonas sp. Irchel s3f10 TaxID=2009137 RepID=UPI000BA373D0|nr:phage antirepressor KilAC domain-containing protein [Pseudomonas sp. Irchel s3f10]
MKMQNTYASASHSPTAIAVIMANGSPIAHHMQSDAVDYIGNSAPLITMSTRELAKLTKKRHGDVIRDVKVMLTDLGLEDDAELRHVEIREDSRGYTSEIMLPRREVEILLTGYSVSLRAKVIDRLHELEGDILKPFRALSDIPTLQALVFTCTNHLRKQDEKIQQDAVKVSFYDSMAGTEDLLNPITASKLLGTGRTNYLQYLRDHKILMSRPNRINMPYQKYLDAGLFEVKLGDYENRKTGEIEAKAHPMLTGKGLIWLSRFIEQNGRDGL